MRQRILTIIAYFAMHVMAVSQDLSGTWSGTLSQEYNGYYTMATTIVQTGNRLSGTSKYTTASGRWVIEGFTGTINGDSVTLSETEVIQYNGEGLGWCLKIMNGALSANKNTIDGAWISTRGYTLGSQPKYVSINCDPGMFKISRKAAPAPKNAATFQSTLTSLGILTGQVFDYQTNRSIKASISIESKTFHKQTSTTSSGGSFNFKLPISADYAVIITADNYEQKREIISLGKAGLNKNFYLTPERAGVQPTVVSTPQASVSIDLKESKPVLLKNVLFRTDSDILLSTSYDALNSLATQMKENHHLRIRLEGHTDHYPKSTAQGNLNLSLKRAAKVKAYLQSKGILADRIETKGYGDTKLICKPLCDDNKRVEFVILAQ